MKNLFINIYNRLSTILIVHKKFLILIYIVIYIVYKITITIHILYTVYSPEQLLNLSHLCVSHFLGILEEEFGPLKMNGTSSNTVPSIFSGTQNTNSNAVSSGVSLPGIQEQIHDLSEGRDGGSSRLLPDINEALPEVNEITRMPYWRRVLSKYHASEVHYMNSNNFSLQDRVAYLQELKSYNIKLDDFIRNNEDSKLQKLEYYSMNIRHERFETFRKTHNLSFKDLFM